MVVPGVGWGSYERGTHVQHVEQVWEEAPDGARVFRVASFDEEPLPPPVDSCTGSMAPMPSKRLQRVPRPQTACGMAGALLFAGASLLASFFLGYVLFFVLTQFCVVCVSIYAVNGVPAPSAPGTGVPRS